MATFQRYKRTQAHPLTIIRQVGLESKGLGGCAYCNSADNLEVDYIVPLSRQGLDRIDNRVSICARCKNSKGSRDLFEWYGKDRRYEIPRLVLAKYLKLAYEAHEVNGTLDSNDMNRDGALDIYDIAAVFLGEDRVSRRAN